MSGFHDNVIGLDRRPGYFVPWVVWRWCFDHASEHWWSLQERPVSGGLGPLFWTALGRDLTEGMAAAAAREDAAGVGRRSPANDDTDDLPPNPLTRHKTMI